MARRKKGSRRREKAKAQLRRRQRKLADRRRTHLHRASAQLVNAYGVIAVEDLAIMNMTASARGTAERPSRNVAAKARLNREVLDTSPGTFAAMLRYKAERAGGRFAAVDPRGTSVECSACGEKVEKGLSQRMHVCPRCNLGSHRDVNAARNILRRAVAGPWSGFGVANGEAASRRSGNVRAA